MVHPEIRLWNGHKWVIVLRTFQFSWKSKYSKVYTDAECEDSFGRQSG